MAQDAHNSVAPVRLGVAAVPGAVALLGALVLLWWWVAIPADAPRREAAEAPPAPPPPSAPVPKWTVLEQRVPPLLEGSWPAFRGPMRDAIGRETTSLAEGWPNGVPPSMWTLAVGEGHAAAAVHAGRVYVLDYDSARGGDALRCFALADGTELWRVFYANPLKKNHGLSRGIPSTDGEVVVCVGPNCHVLACDARSGQPLWTRQLVADFGARVPQWWSAQCPLLDGDRVVLAPCGDEVRFCALDRRTGATVWTTPNPGRWPMSHSTLAPFSFRGRRLAAYQSTAGVCAVDLDSGELVWQSDAFKVPTAAVAMPVCVGDGLLFVSGGYGAGSALLKMTGTAAPFSTEVVYRLPARVFGAEQQTPIVHDGSIYGVATGGELVCLDPQTGRRRWASGTVRFGLGPYLLADGRLYVVDDHGTLAVVRAIPDRFDLLWRGEVLDGADSWGPLALAGGRLILRNLHRMACLDVRRAQGAQP